VFLDNVFLDEDDGADMSPIQSGWWTTEKGGHNCNRITRCRSCVSIHTQISTHSQINNYYHQNHPHSTAVFVDGGRLQAQMGSMGRRVLQQRIDVCPPVCVRACVVAVRWRSSAVECAAAKRFVLPTMVGVATHIGRCRCRQRAVSAGLLSAAVCRHHCNHVRIGCLTSVITVVATTAGGRRSSHTPFLATHMTDSESSSEDETEFVNTIAQAASSSKPDRFAQKMQRWFPDESRDAVASACSLQETNKKKKKKKKHKNSGTQLQEAHSLWSDHQWGLLLDDTQRNTAYVVKNIKCLFDYEFPVHSAFSIFCNQEPQEEVEEIRPFEQIFMLLLFNTSSQDVVKQAAIRVAKRSFREKGLRLIGLQVVPRLFTNDVRTHKVHLAFCCVCSCN
jgi:hypothetical protein